MELQAITTDRISMILISLNMVFLVHVSTSPVHSSYCQPGTPLPNITLLDLPCYSCKDKCGTRNFCSCDTQCRAYGDCCPDFPTLCPVEFKNGLFLKDLFKYRYTKCVPLGIRPYQCLESSLVSVCGKTGEICQSARYYNLSVPNLSLPVTDLDTGISYVNFLCAKCNGATNLTWIKPSIFCGYSTTRLDPTADNMAKVNSLLSRPGCKLLVDQESARGINLSPFCREKTSPCLESCNNADLVAGCKDSIFTNYVRGRTVYPNTYCALCAGEVPENLQCQKLWAICGLPGPPDGGFSVSILFDFNPSDGLVVGQHPCPMYQARIGGTGDCHQVACPSDLRFFNGACLPLSYMVNFMNVTLTFNVTKDAQLSVSWFMNNKLTPKVEEAISIQINQSMYNSYQSDVKLKVIQNVSDLTENQFNISFTATLEVDANSTVDLGDDLHKIFNITKYMSDQILLGLAEVGVNLGQVEMIINEKVTFNQKPLDDCTWFAFHNDQFTFMNGSVRLDVTNKVYDETQFRPTGDQVIVCVAMTDMTAVVLNISQTLVILSLVLISLSIICLLIRIILQFAIPYYRSFAGRLHANLCLALMLAFIMVLVTGTVYHYNKISVGVKGQDNVIIASVDGHNYLPLACALSGAIMYWFFMAAFIWMTALSIDVWIKLHPIYLVERRLDDKRSIAPYATLCWLIPFLISVVVFGLDFTDIDSRFRPEFGMRLCWFNQRYALLAYFGSVVAICMMLIIIFLIKTALNIPLQPKFRCTEQRHAVRIYLRLAALMGVCWVFGFVAAFVGHEAIWIVYIVLNASQGILIFISFVFKRKVFQQCCCIIPLIYRAIWPVDVQSSDQNQDQNEECSQF